MKRTVLALLAAIVAAVLAGLGYTWKYHGEYGLNVLLRRGGSYWITVSADDPRLSPAMRAALLPVIPSVVPGALEWREVEPGFEVADLPVLAGDVELDRIYFHRIDPARFRLVARNAPAGDKDIDQWESALPAEGAGGTVLIVNGSYFGLKGEVDTPFVSEGVRTGPAAYDARAGAWVDDGARVGIVDLADKDWRTVLDGATNAMVSYPLLLDAAGRNRVTVKSNWLANRTFVAEDHAGRMLVGSTKDAFFSLDRLAAFLLASPLDLKTALNLDGGPIAGLSVRSGTFRRKHYAEWEAQVDKEGRVQLLRAPISAPWGMPVILTVERRG